LAEFFPELASTGEVVLSASGPGAPERTLLELLLTATEKAEPVLELRLAALLHRSAAVEQSGDEVALARRARATLTRLKFPNKVIDEVTHLISHHRVARLTDAPDPAIRRFLSVVGPAHLPRLLAL